MPSIGAFSSRPERSSRTICLYRSAPIVPSSACDGDEYPPSVVSW
jgi:hypothetical protein